MCEVTIFTSECGLIRTTTYRKIEGGAALFFLFFIIILHEITCQGYIQ